MLKIIYEDNNILVINKPNNLVVNNVEKSNNLLNIINKYCSKIKNVENNGIVHRLDKDTTGLLIIAKDNHSFYNLKKDFYFKKIIKKYISIVTGEMIFSGKIDKPISRDKINRKIMSINNLGKKSITHYKIIKKLFLHTLIKIILETGRTHQIRVHMSYINHPILGDLKYKKNSSNYKKSNNFFLKKNILINKQVLHSYKLIFKHPISRKILNLKTEFPKYINNIINIINIK